MRLTPASLRSHACSFESTERRKNESGVGYWPVDLAAYQINVELMAFAKPGTIFLHRLPAHCCEEMTADVIDEPSPPSGSRPRTASPPSSEFSTR